LSRADAMLRLGLAGMGVHGQRYARHLLAGDVPGARLAAVSRSNEAAGRAFAGEHGLRFAADPRELAVLRGLDGVVLVLPPDLHAPAAEACVAAGRPVLVEKPMAADLAAARHLAAEVQRRGCLLMLGQTLRFDAVIEAVRREVPGVGPLRSVSLSQRLEPAGRPWIDVPGRGGVLLNTGVHGFDLLRHLTGLEAGSLQAECARAVARHTEDQFVAIVRLEPGGVLAVVDSARTTRSRCGRIEVVGAEGQVWGDHIHRTVTRLRDGKLTDLGPFPHRPTVPAALAAFVRCIRGEIPPPITAADGVATIELCEAVRLSAREGRRVVLAELRGG
jgi:predicted dehydrogenase